MSIVQKRLSVAAGLVVACVAAGCVPPPVVDAPASGLEILPTIIDLGSGLSPGPGSDGKVPVIVQFVQAGKFVQLASTNTVTCNGVALGWNGLGYAERIPLVAAGGHLAIAHQRLGVTTAVNVPVPQRPVVTSPAAGALLPRTAGLVFQYVPATSEGVRPGASDGATGLGGSEQPDTGTATLDVTSLRPGAGTISLSRRIVTAPAASGFGSVRATYTISSVEAHVTWQ